MAEIPRYGPRLVQTEVTPTPRLGSGAIQTFAAFASGFDAVNKFLRPAVVEVKTREGQQEAAEAVEAKGPKWELKQSGSVIAGEAARRNAALRRYGGPTNQAAAALNKEGGGGLTFFNEGQDKLDPHLRGILSSVAPKFGGLGITSGYRTPERNAAVGGAPNSLHVSGKAADISMAGLSEQERAQLVTELMQGGARGFITYSNSPDMLHVDLGGDSRPNLHFMHDKSNRNIQNAPEWFRAIAAQYQGAGGVDGVVPIPATPEYELDLVNQNTFEPRLPFTVRDAAFNASADRLIGARAKSALELAMVAAMTSSEDLTQLKANMEKARSDILAQLPNEMPGLREEIEIAFQNASQVAQRTMAQKELNAVVAQQEEALQLTDFNASEGANRLALGGGSPEELATHMVLAQDDLARFGPREAFTLNGKQYPADATRAGLQTPAQLNIRLKKAYDAASALMLQSEFERSEAKGAFAAEFTRRVLSGEGPLDPGTNLRLMREFNTAARVHESARRSEANEERRRLRDETSALINSYVQMTEAGVPIAIPPEERAAILKKLAPYPELQREAELEFAVADAAVETHGMSGPELIAYTDQIRDQMKWWTDQGLIDLEGAAVVASLQDRVKKAQDAVTNETLGLPLIEQLALDGARHEDIDWQSLRDRAVGKPELLRTIAEVETFYKDIESLSGMSAAERQSAIEGAEEMLAALAAGGDNFGAAALVTQHVVERLGEYSDKRAAMAKDDPLRFAEANGIALPDLNSAESLTQVGELIGQRVRLIAPLSEKEGVDFPVPLSREEIDGLGEVFRNTRQSERMAFIASIADLGQEQARAIFGGIGTSQPELYAAGVIYTLGNKDAASMVLRGSGDEKLQGGDVAAVTVARQGVLGELMKQNMLAPGVVEELDAVAMAYARGVAISKGGVPITPDMLSAGYQAALGQQKDGTGGVVRTSFGTTIAPPGYNARQFSRAVRAITEEQLVEMNFGEGANRTMMITDASDRPLSLEDVRDNAFQMYPVAGSPTKFIPRDRAGNFFVVQSGNTVAPLVIDLGMMK